MNVNSQIMDNYTIERKNETKEKTSFQGLLLNVKLQKIINKNFKKMTNYIQHNYAIVTFENGDKISTFINGTIPVIQRYYAIGKQFNLGIVNDNLQKVKSLTIGKRTLT